MLNNSFLLKLSKGTLVLKENFKFFKLLIINIYHIINPNNYLYFFLLKILHKKTLNILKILININSKI
jgi:hypothetical protein